MAGNSGAVKAVSAPHSYTGISDVPCEAVGAHTEASAMTVPEQDNSLTQLAMQRGCRKLMPFCQ